MNYALTCHVAVIGPIDVGDNEREACALLSDTLHRSTRGTQCMRDDRGASLSGYSGGPCDLGDSRVRTRSWVSESGLRRCWRCC